MKLVFAGTPEFAATALAALHQAGHEIALVLTQPDRPAGRGMQLQASPVKQYATTHGIEVAQPVSLRLDGKHPDIARAAHEKLAAIAPDVMVVAAYGLILPRSILELPRLGCINIHASLLPRWRGAAPIHRAIEAGDAQTGITIMQMDEGLDTGAMLLAESVPIEDADTTGSLHDKLAVLGGSLIVEALTLLESGELRAVPQPSEGVTYAAKISKDEAHLDFSQPAPVIVRKVRAFSPFPGAAAVFDGTLLKIWQARLVPMATVAAPGTVLRAAGDELIVACGTGAVQIDVLQKAGGKRLPTREFLKAFPMANGRFTVDAAADIPAAG